MVFSRPCQYAIQAMTCLAAIPGRPARAEKIAQAEDIPQPVLSKVLQDLVRKGLLESRRGPGGGFTLSRRPELITLRDIVAAIDGLDQFYTCVTGLPVCSEEVPCPLHGMWKEMRVGLMETFETTTLQDMTLAVARKRQSLATAKRRTSAKSRTVR